MRARPVNPPTTGTFAEIVVIAQCERLGGEGLEDLRLVHRLQAAVATQAAGRWHPSMTSIIKITLPKDFVISVSSVD